MFESCLEHRTGNGPIIGRLATDWEGTKRVQDEEFGSLICPMCKQLGGGQSEL